MDNLSYSLHLGSDKNKKTSSRNMAKNNKSGSTSLSNNAIQNARQLSRVDNHNYRKYDNENENIAIVRGTTSLVDDVKNIYHKEFDYSLKEYNDKQKRDDRKIKNYFDYVSNNSKNDLACELIIELGDKTYWDTKDDNFKKRMTSVYTKQVEDLELLLPNFKVASAIIHYDETSPHMHIVGIPIKNKNKYGLSKQIGKSDVFTKDSLRVLQDKMRTLCIESFNKEYNLNFTLKTKQKGRNKDINVKDMTNYAEMKKELDKRQNDLDQANKKSLELDFDSKEVKDLINDLKTTLTSKDKYILKEEDKNKLLKYVDKVESTNKDYEQIKTLSVTLNNVNDELQDNRKKIKTLAENNEALNLRVSTLEDKIDKQENEIYDLKEENNSLKSKLISLTNRIKNLIKFLTKKMFSRDDRELYHDFARDLYTHKIITDEEMYEIHDEYKFSKEKDYKNKTDDFEL